MPVTMNQVRAYLDPEEPDYPAAAQLGEDAVPYLMQLIEGSDSMLASKATYLASLIQSDQSNDVLEQAAVSNHVEVRLAAAAGIRNLKKAPISIIVNLLKDPDIGVLKVTLRSIKALPIKILKFKIDKIDQKDSEVTIRNLANEIAKQL